MNYISFDTGLCYDFGYDNRFSWTITTCPLCITSTYNWEEPLKSYGVYYNNYVENCIRPGYPMRYCNDYIIQVVPINYRQASYHNIYITCMDYEYYSYNTTTTLSNPEKIKINNSDPLKEIFVDLTLETTHPRINDALPHPKTYGYVPINARFVDSYIYPDAMSYFAKLFKLLIRDQVTGTVYSVWYDSVNAKIKLTIENEPFNVPVHDYILTTNEVNLIYKVEIKGGTLVGTNVTNEIGLTKKVIPQYNIIPDITNLSDYNIITSYRIYYRENSGFYFKPFDYNDTVMDIRAYNLQDSNYEEVDSVQLVHQIIKFNEFYNNYISKIFVNFKKRFTHGQYPLFEVYDQFAVLKNIQISHDTLNQREPEPIYLYVVTSDFKILSKIKVIEGLDVKIEKLDNHATYEPNTIRYKITAGDLGLFDVKYIDGSNYADVYVSEKYHKTTKIYFFFAPDKFVSTKYDYLYNYRFISFEYSDSRNFDISNMYKNSELNQPIIEIRDPIRIKGIKSLELTRTQIWQDLRAQLYPKINQDRLPVIETTDYQHVCCGFKTKCGKYFTYVIFVEPQYKGDANHIVIQTYEEEFDDYILAQLRDNIDIRERLRSYIVTFDFIRSLICEYDKVCDDVQLICWNRMLDVPTATDANIIQTRTFPDKYLGDLTLQYIVNSETTAAFITRNKFLSEYTLGEHNNFVLNHQNFSRVKINSKEYTAPNDCVEIRDIVIEPDVIMIDRDTYEEYRPFSLGLRCPNDANIQDTRWAVVPAYKLSDGTQHIIYRPEDYKTGCYLHPYILKFVAPVHVKLWESFTEMQQFENLNSSSNLDTVLEYKLNEELDLLNIELPDKNFKLINYVGISMKFYKNIDDLKNKDESQQLEYYYDIHKIDGLRNYTIFPNRKIDDKPRWYISSRHIPSDKYSILGYIGLKYIMIEYQNFIYMPTRQEILVEDTNSFIKLDTVGFDPDHLNPVRYEYLTNITYVNFEFSDTTSYLITSHMNEITNRISYNKIQSSKYLYDLKHYQAVATYRNNFINTTIAKG